MRNPVCLLCAFIALLCAQQFAAQNTYLKSLGFIGSDYAQGSARLHDSTIVMVGTVHDSDGYVTRYNLYGDTLWTRRIDDPIDNTSLYSVQETKDHALIAVGAMNMGSNSASRITLIKMNLAGHILWRKVYATTNMDQSSKVVCTWDKGFLIAGYSTDTTAFDDDMLIIKADSVGTVVWTKIINGSPSDIGLSIMEMPSHDIMISGAAVSNDYDVLLIRLDAAGTLEWAKTYDGGGYEIGYDLARDQIGNIYVCGADLVGSALYMKVDSVGNFVWGRAIQNTDQQILVSLSPTKSGNFLCSGYQIIGGQTLDNFAIKFKPNGDTLWTHLYEVDPTNDDWSMGILEMMDGSVLLTGATSDANFVPDQLLIKTDSMGKAPCAMLSQSNQVANINLSGATYVFATTTTISTTTAPSKLLSEGTTSVICMYCPAPANPVDITPVGNKTICEPLTTTLAASGTGTLSWYASATSTQALHVGTSYHTPTLSAGVYTYYVEAETCTLSASRTAVTVTVSTCVGLSEATLASGLRVYPNPYSDKTIVELGSAVHDVVIVLSDASGRVVKTVFASTNRAELDRAGLAAGIYFLSVQGASIPIPPSKLVVVDR